MSYVLTLSDNSSDITVNYFPAINLEDGEYRCALIDLQTFNSIPNIDQKNNTLHFDDDKVIVLPTGNYEIEDINRYVKKKFKKIFSPESEIDIKANNNTLKSEIFCTETIHFDKEHSIGPLLGFARRTLSPSKKRHESDRTVQILDINSLLVECNLIGHSYLNERACKTLHEFFPAVGPGYKIMEKPNSLIYLPVTVKAVDSLRVRIVDQNRNLVNFRGETITIRMHLEKV